MKIVENNFKCDEITIIDHKFYLKITKFSSNFVAAVGLFFEKIVLEIEYLNGMFSGPGVSLGGLLPLKVILHYFQSKNKVYKDKVKGAV